MKYVIEKIVLTKSCGDVIDIFSESVCKVVRKYKVQELQYQVQIYLKLEENFFGNYDITRLSLFEI